MEQSEFACDVGNNTFFVQPLKDANCSTDFTLNNGVETIQIKCTENQFTIPVLPPPHPYNHLINKIYPTNNSQNLACPNYKPVNFYNVETTVSQPLPSFAIPLIASLSVLLAAFGLLVLGQVLKWRRRRKKGKYIPKIKREESLRFKIPLIKKKNSLESNSNYNSTVDGSMTLKKKKNVNVNVVKDTNGQKVTKTTIIVGQTPDRYTGGASTWRPAGMPNEKFTAILGYIPSSSDELFISPGDILLVEHYFEDGWVHVKRIEQSLATETYLNGLKVTEGSVPFHCLTPYRPGIVSITHRNLLLDKEL